MSKIQFKPPALQNTNTNIQRQQFSNRIYIEENKTNDSTVAEMFQVIREADYQNIKKFIYEKNISLGATNEDGDTVLHQIIANSNIEPREKLELCELVIEYGAPVDASNKQSITPLHMAAKFQLPRIVDLLCLKSVNKNATDNQSKSALHYACLGVSGECPPNPKKKKFIDKISKKKSVQDLKKLEGLVTKYMYAKPEIQKDIKSISENINQIDVKYGGEIDSLIEKNRIEIVELYEKNAFMSEEAIQILLRKKIDESKKALVDTVITKISKSMEKIDFAQNPPNSNVDMWDNVVNEINLKFTKLQTQNISHQGDVIDNINKNVKQMTDVSDDINRLLRDIVDYYIGIYNADNVNIANINECSDDIKKKFATMLYYYKYINIQQISPDLLKPHNDRQIININNIAQNILPPNKYYWNTLFNFYVEVINQKIQLLKRFENNNFMSFYTDMIPNRIISILSICICLIKIYGMIDMFDSKISHITNFFNDITITDANRDILEQIKTIINNSKTDIDKLRGQCVDIYSDCRNMINILNNIKQAYEIRIEELMIKAYITKNIPDLYYDRAIRDIEMLPISFDDFIKSYNKTDINQIKYTLFNKFMPYINAKNYMTFFFSNKNLRDMGIQQTIPICGFINPFGIDYENHFSEYLAIHDNKTIVGKLNKSLDDLNGKVGIDVRKSELTNENFLFLKHCFGDYLYLLKHNIINHTITHLPSNIIELLKTFTPEKKIHSLIVAKIVDAHMIAFFNRSIAKKCNSILQIKLANLSNSNLSSILTNPIIFASDKDFEIDMNDVDVDMIEIFDDASTMLADTANIHLGNIMDEPDTNPSKKHKILSYLQDIREVQQLYFDIDPDVVDILLKHGADLNIQDILGNTPVYYTIEMMNYQLTSMLLNNNASLTHHTNQQGNSAFDHYLYKYYEMIRLISENNILVDKTLLSKTINEFRKKSKYENGIIKYTNELLPIALYMLNHHIFLLGERFPITYTFEIDKDLKALLGWGVYRDTFKLPLLSTNLSNTDIPQLDLNYSKIKELEKLNKLYQSQKDEAQHLVDNMTKQKQELNNLKPFTIEQNEKQAQIQGIITYNQAEIVRLDILITTQEADIQKYKAPIDNVLNGIQQKISAHTIKPSRNVVENYQSVFKDVINHSKKIKLLTTDYKTYPALWRKLLSDQSSLRSDPTQIVSMLVEKQKQILESSDTIEKKVADLLLIKKYYDSVINPFIGRYMDLEQIYKGDNKELDTVINIIIHLVEHIVMVELTGIIVKMIMKYLLTIMPKDTNPQGDIDPDRRRITYPKYIEDIIINMVHESKNKSKLLEYIFKVLPRKIVKFVLHIYQTDNPKDDEDSETDNLETLFLHINVILLSNTIVPLTPDSPLIKNLSEYVYPYFSDYLGMFVKEMKQMIDNYILSLKYQATNLSMLDMLVDKAQKEYA